MQLNVDNFGPIDLKKENRKTFSIRVFPDGKIILKAPIQSTLDECQNFVTKKIYWIKKQIDFFSKFKSVSKKVYENGCSLLYLGRQYQFIIQKSLLKDFIKIDKNKIIFYTPHPNDIVKITEVLDSWFLNKSYKVFQERLNIVMKTFNDFEMPLLKIRKLNKRWGSYLSNHEIILNPQLIQASKSSIDYVITHELCHFYYKNHSKKFYDLLSIKIPNWQKIKNDLEYKLLGK